MDSFQQTAPCSKIWVDCSPTPSSLRDQGALRPWITVVSGEIWGWRCPEPLGGHGRRDWRKPVQEIQVTWVDPWVRKIPLEESIAIHCRILAWKIPWTEEPGEGSLKRLSMHTHTAGTGAFSSCTLHILASMPWDPEVNYNIS